MSEDLKKLVGKIRDVRSTMAESFVGEPGCYECNGHGFILVATGGAMDDVSINAAIELLDRSIRVREAPFDGDVIYKMACPECLDFM